MNALNIFKIVVKVITVVPAVVDGVKAIRRRRKARNARERAAADADLKASLEAAANRGKGLAKDIKAAR